MDKPPQAIPQGRERVQKGHDQTPTTAPTPTPAVPDKRVAVAPRTAPMVAARHNHPFAWVLPTLAAILIRVAATVERGLTMGSWERTTSSINALTHNTLIGVMSCCQGPRVLGWFAKDHTTVLAFRYTYIHYVYICTYIHYVWFKSFLCVECHQVFILSVICT